MFPLAAYVLLFIAVGVGFIFVHLVAGMLLRPSKPGDEKGTIYECGEPTIGSAWIQFDLRFYVVALLFVIFDVEVAFFFPWAEVFGKSNAVASAPEPRSQDGASYQEFARRVLDLAPEPTSEQQGRLQKPYRDLLAMTPGEAGEKGPDLLRGPDVAEARAAASRLATLALVEVLVFFGALLVGFAYLWRRGDLDWVRAVTQERRAALSSGAARGLSPDRAGDRELVGGGRA